MWDRAHVRIGVHELVLRALPIAIPKVREAPRIECEWIVVVVIIHMCGRSGTGQVGALRYECAWDVTYSSVRARHFWPQSDLPSEKV